MALHRHRFLPLAGCPRRRKASEEFHPLARATSPAPKKTLPLLAFNSGNCHNIIPTMNTKLTLDKAGRIVLPKPVRDEMELVPGDTLELESSEDEITLRPLRGNAPLRKKNGVWVFRVGESLTNSVVQKTVNQVRRERAEQILGKKH